jgi:hypothetical protein
VSCSVVAVAFSNVKNVVSLCFGVALASVSFSVSSAVSDLMLLFSLA